MKKKGFTLIELLVVIVLLGVVMVIAVTAVNGVSNSVKNKMYDEKIDFIAEAAVLYGENHKDFLTSSTSKYEGYNCIVIKAKNLVPDYIDNDNPDVDTKDCASEAKCIINPLNKQQYLDELEVIVYLRNRIVKAFVNEDNTPNLCR